MLETVTQPSLTPTTNQSAANKSNRLSKLDVAVKIASAIALTYVNAQFAFLGAAAGAIYANCVASKLSQVSSAWHIVHAATLVFGAVVSSCYAVPYLPAAIVFMGMAHATKELIVRYPTAAAKVETQPSSQDAIAQEEEEEKELANEAPVAEVQPSSQEAIAEKEEEEEEEKELANEAPVAEAQPSSQEAAALMLR